MQQLFSIGSARHHFVAGLVPQLESNRPDVVEEMLASSTQMFPIGSDGVCRSGKSGRMKWTPRVSTAQLTEGFGAHLSSAKTAAAVSIADADGIISWGQPYCAELPAAILELIKAEPDGELGQTYQRYVQTALLPGVRLVAEILRVHGATIGTTPVASLKLFRSAWQFLTQPTSISQCPCRVAIVGVAKREVRSSIQH
eukprot:SAG31_NODE_222_length_19895_cov_34.907626_7_plen_198_part_00